MVAATATLDDSSSVVATGEAEAKQLREDNEAKLRQEHATALAAAQARSDERVAAVEQAGRAVEDGLRNELEEAGARLIASEERAAKLDEKVDKAEAAVEEFDDIATALDTQLRERTAEVMAVTAERERLETTVAELQAEIGRLREAPGAAGSPGGLLAAPSKSCL